MKLKIRFSVVYLVITPTATYQARLLNLNNQQYCTSVIFKRCRKSSKKTKLPVNFLLLHLFEIRKTANKKRQIEMVRAVF